MEEREFLARYFAMSSAQKTAARAIMVACVVPVMIWTYSTEFIHGLHLAFRYAWLAALEDLQSYRRIRRMIRPGSRQ